MTRLNSKRRCRFFDNKRLFEKSSENFDGVIVCHRSSSQAAIPDLPYQCTALRTVVLSDCVDEQVIVGALNFGAHHYINLFQSEFVLAARLDAALRFHPNIERYVLEVNPYVFRACSRSVYHGKQRVDLSPREFQLAYYLFTNRDRVILDSELLSRVWTLPSSIDTRRIDTAICRIRNKLGLQLESSQWTLVRLRGKGFRLLCKVPEEVGQNELA